MKSDSQRKAIHGNSIASNAVIPEELWQSFDHELNQIQACYPQTNQGEYYQESATATQQHPNQVVGKQIEEDSPNMNSEDKKCHSSLLRKVSYHRDELQSQSQKMKALDINLDMCCDIEMASLKNKSFNIPNHLGKKDGKGKYQQVWMNYQEPQYDPILKRKEDFDDFQFFQEKSGEIPNERSRKDSLMSAVSNDRRSNKYEDLSVNDKHFYCKICYSDVDIKEIMYIQCGHYFCRKCFSSYLDYIINQSGQFYQIKCPNTECQRNFTQEQLHNILNKNTYQKLQRYMINYEVSRSSNRKFCPQIGCEAIVECKEEGQKKTLCLSCQKHFCFKCSIPWHQGISCLEAQQKSFKSWASEFGISQCPSCYAPVQKEEGCSHMNCIICNYRWCWICGKDLKHWIHKIEFSPFSCQKAPKNLKNTFQFVLLFIIGLILMPLIVFLFISAICIFYGVHSFSAVYDFFHRWNYLITVLLMPIIIIFIGVVSIASIGLSGLVIIVMLPLAYFIHIYAFIIVCRWWRNSKPNAAK